MNFENALSVVLTADGSKTIFNPHIGENYHSKHGALQESKHVFIQEGLAHFLKDKHLQQISVLEVGFGTGLNFLLTADFCKREHVHLNYLGIEAFPLDNSLLKQTGYEQYVSEAIWSAFTDKYAEAMQQTTTISPSCELKIAHIELMNFQSASLFDMIYFDAFSAIHQPEMWSDQAIEFVCQYLKPGGVFVTYAITGHLKRALKKSGFMVEKAPGAPGKREMLRATKQAKN